MTDDEILAIEERCSGATPGPWAREMADDEDGPVETKNVEGPPLEDEGYYNPIAECHHGHDADFIVHAREDMPRLCSALRDAERGLSQVIGERDYYEDEVDRIAVRLGCDQELSNLHAHASCIDDRIEALEQRAERAEALALGLERDVARLNAEGVRQGIRIRLAERRVLVTEQERDAARKLAAEWERLRGEAYDLYRKAGEECDVMRAKIRTVHNAVLARATSIRYEEFIGPREAAEALREVATLLSRCADTAPPSSRRPGAEVCPITGLENCLSCAEHAADEAARADRDARSREPHGGAPVTPCPRCLGRGYLSEDPLPECPAAGEYEEHECPACEGSGEASAL